VLALGGMIFVHELGHFLAARFFKIEVEEFGFGLPSIRLATLFKWQGTEFTIHALPLGGFVRPKGENDPSVPGGLAAASPWQRIAVLLAGPLMNLLTAVVVYALITALQGVPLPGPVRLEQVSPDSPALQAGLQPGDRILAVDGQTVEYGSEVSRLIYDRLDQPIQLLIERDGQQLSVTLTPLSSRYARGEGPIGILMAAPETRPATAFESVRSGVLNTGLQAAGLVYLPIALIQGVVNPADARPVGLKGIFDLVNSAVEEDTSSRQAGPGQPAQPTNYTLLIIGMLSVSLGVLNLLPVPALDGGRILFTLPELLFHRRIPPEAETIVNGVAMLLLIFLMLYINVLDFVNPMQYDFP
jgi:regulator of sigma E protease